MKAVEFTTELGGDQILAIPVEIAEQLPKSGKIRVIILPLESAEAQWRKGAYEQFMREDPPEDEIYDRES